MRALVVVALIACSGTAPPGPAAPANRVEGDPGRQDGDDDGIADAHDRCPAEVEDYDAYADDDGCPDPDNDGDGVTDELDDCPYDAGPGGCVTPCRVFVLTNDDCILEPTVFYDEHDVPQAARLDEIVALVGANPSVQGLEVLGDRAELVAEPLRARLPAVEITVEHRDVGIDRAVYVRITRQRFDEGRFRTTDCTSFGPIYRPTRAANCSR